MDANKGIGTVLGIGLLMIAAGPILLALTGWIDVRNNSWPGFFAGLSMFVFTVGFAITVIGAATQ